MLGEGEPHIRIEYCGMVSFRPLEHERFLIMKLSDLNFIFMPPSPKTVLEN